MFINPWIALLDKGVAWGFREVRA